MSRCEIAGNPVAELCPQCGLCCNGVLFADVEVQSADRAADLLKHGMALRRKEKGGKLAFAQPCPSFDGAWCRIYQERPGRCRSFECGVLKRVQAGRLDPTGALRLIREVQAQAAKVRDQLRALGNRDEHLPLSRRYARTMEEPFDLAGDEQVIETRAELMLDVAHLMKLIQRHFLR